MTEQAHVWTPLKKNSPPSVHWQRIENTAGTGAPDLTGAHDGVEVWIENKIYDGNKLHFRPTQPGWLFKHRRTGARVFVLARKKKTFYLYDAARVFQLVAEGIKTPAIVTLEPPWDWSALLAAIFGHKVA